MRIKNGNSKIELPKTLFKARIKLIFFFIRKNPISLTRYSQSNLHNVSKKETRVNKKSLIW